MGDAAWRGEETGDRIDTSCGPAVHHSGRHVRHVFETRNVAFNCQRQQVRAPDPSTLWTSNPDGREQSKHCRERCCPGNKPNYCALRTPQSREALLLEFEEETRTQHAKPWQSERLPSLASSCFSYYVSYVELAVRLGRDAEYRRWAGNLIGQRSSALWERRDVLLEWARFLSRAAGRNSPTAEEVVHT